MIVNINKDGLLCGGGVIAQGYLFNLFAYNGKAHRVMTGNGGGFLPPTDGYIYIGYRLISVDTYGTIEYNKENKVVSLGGKKVEYSSNGEVARIGSTVIKGRMDIDFVREQMAAYDAKHKSRNKDGWKFSQSGDILSYNGIAYEYGELIDFGGDMPWSLRRVLSGIGGVKIKYHPDGRVWWIDGRNIEYDSQGRFVRV